VLTAAKSSRHHPALVLIAATGLRKGEALGLSWAQVNLKAGVLKVAATLGRVEGELLITEPKTERSHREIPLHPGVIALLHRQRIVQKIERLRAGEQWTNTDDLVFTTETGDKVDPDKLLRAIKAAAKTAGASGAVVHTLRHSAAVAWLESGVHIKAVSDLLGHSSVAITGDVYGHTSDSVARSAIDTLGGALGL
jgi:integrase